MQIGSTTILDAFAEASRLQYARLVITADDEHWLGAALRAVCGYGTSLAGCDAEVGVERHIAHGETPDGRPGAAVLFFGSSAEALAKSVPNRVGQCVMTCPTTACYDACSDACSEGLPPAASTSKIALGKHLRFFGDGYQKSKKQGGTRYWRIPVMDGEFLVEETARVAEGIGGASIAIQAVSQPVALAAARRASDAIAALPGVMTPFPGGVVRQGVTAGSRASETGLADGATCSYDVVLDGVDESAVVTALRAAIEAAAGDGVLAIGAPVSSPAAGELRFHLREVAGRREEG